MKPLESAPERPGHEIREPSRTSPDYLAKALLVRDLRAAVAEYCVGRSDLDVLDVGCGDKPYLPILEPHSRSYRGIDVTPGRYVDDVGVGEALPYPDASFDVVLCTQLLEHADDPLTVVREIHRILRPDGVALISTHGVFVFHPDPPPDRDFWRWTHAGLIRLCQEAGQWTSIDVRANGEYFACLALLICRLAGWPLGRAPEIVRRTIYRAINTLALFMDARLPEDLRVPSPNSLSANYLVVARRDPGRPADARLLPSTTSSR